jgi:hypothetical protein
MAAFLIFLSVMGNAAAVVALALHLDPELTGLMSRTLFYIGTVPLTFGLCGFGVFVGAARDVGPWNGNGSVKKRRGSISRWPPA